MLSKHNALWVQPTAVDVSLSLEDGAGSGREIERVYYARLSDVSQLSRAQRSETHFQWERRVYNKAGEVIGTERSREIDDGEHYEYTIKVRDGQPGVDEHTLGSSKEMHQVMRQLAERGLSKIRYCFPVKTNAAGESIDLVWEIDAFVLPDGSLDPWVKVDLEVPSADIVAPSFPLRVDDIIDNSFDQTVPSDRMKIIDNLYQRVLRSPT